MFSIGVSAMTMQLFFIVQQTLLYRTAFQYGGESNGILMAASLRFFGFSFIPLWGMAQGLQPVVGTNYGAKQYQRVKESMRIFMIGGVFLSLVFYIPAEIFPSLVLQLFNVNANILKEGINHFRLFYSVFILYGVMIMNITFFQSIGSAKKANLLVMFRQLILFVPCIIFIPKYFGIDGVWIAQPLVDFVMIVVGLIMQEVELRKMALLE